MLVFFQSSVILDERYLFVLLVLIELCPAPNSIPMFLFLTISAIYMTVLTLSLCVNYIMFFSVSEITEENKFPTDRQLMFISKCLAPNEGYREVALELLVPENDIIIIEEENQRCQSRSYKVLQKWVQLFSEQATVTKLLHTLEHVGKRNVIDKFRQEYIDIFINTSRHTPTVLAN